MKYLIVKPVGGLANRIRVLEASYNYALIHGAQLTVIWEKNPILNAAFEECFELFTDANVFNFDYNGISIFSKFKRKSFDIVEAVGRAFYTSEKKFDVDIEPVLTDTKPTEKSKDFFDTIAKRNKGLFLETCYEFYPNVKNYTLPIKADIKQRAFQMLQPYPSLIGIHIRRTDHVDSIARSPLQIFIDEIDRQLTLKPDTSFYLSTDSDEVVKELRNLYSDKIITGVAVRNRYSKKGITDALTDLCCLSQCKKILGSFKSSFSERAAIIGNIPLQIVSA